MSSYFPCCLVFIPKLFISLNEKAMRCGLFPDLGCAGRGGLCSGSLAARAGQEQPQKRLCPALRQHDAALQKSLADKSEGAWPPSRISKTDFAK